jgi:hypothetical protein
LTTTSYYQFKNDIERILNLKNKQELTEQICLLSWEVSFISKEKRIERILGFIEKEKLINIKEQDKKIDILELILALSHLRRAKYNEAKRKN